MGFVLVLLLVWTIIHGTNYLLRLGKAQSLLPTPRFAPRQLHFWNTRSTQIILNKLHVRIQTSAWNGVHDILSKAVAARSGARVRALIYFYNVGSVAGILGSAISLGLLIWNCGRGLLPLFHNSLVHLSPVSPPAPLARRGSDVTENRPTVIIAPLIPGVTTPLSDLPVILIAVFLSQTVHELGHAISAALNAVPIVSAGASFTVVVPAAFVTFPTTAMEALRPWPRSQIIAAGPFHNLVFWALLLLVDHLGTGDLLMRLLYRDISDLGRVVMHTDRQDSDLREYLPLGSLITKLDDMSLGSPVDRWTPYLTSPPGFSSGWCVDRADYLANPQSCCDPQAPFSHLSCFVAVSPAEKGCLDAIPILTTGQKQRCESDSNCESDSRCVHPHEHAQLLRLTVHFDGRDQVILWRGPLTEVHEQVKVGNFRPRFRLLPLWAYVSTSLFWDYLKLATLSLYLFNLLPLPHLDGTQFMQALLDMVLPDGTGFDEYDVEALEAATNRNQVALSRNRARWKSGLGRGIPIVTTCIFILSTLLALITTR
ncbi:hypothetical protein GGX14DRAFT_699937 [Mycena pura]|uniref:Endopeptidase S2P n=1 Tax=Mycena pura TaxID=153505 RepID=A0AAD6Y319_9AGAR|nr:hypothetical protein GGX14DRAFT_699937 [Mycena pura]